MPEPRSDETREEWMGRCMGSEEAMRDFPGQDQRAAFCNSRWERFQGNAVRTFRGPAKAGSGIRYETFEGKQHLVAPVVMIVEGVLNNALVPAEEFGKYPQSWDGEPVPVLHPERNGSPIPANSPDVIERNTIGRLFNTRAEDKRLKSEAWIDIQKARDLGHGDLVDQLERGDVVEVSTGYFADAEVQQGEYDGQPYREIHRNIRPDHLALLPGETGACSVADGCGTRTNSKGFAMKLTEAFQTLAQAAGLRANIDEGGKTMSHKLIQQAEQLKAHEMITPEQLEMLQGMDQEQLEMVATLAQKLAEKDMEPEEPEGPEGEPAPSGEAPEGERMKRQSAQPVTNEQVQAMVQEGMRRERVAERLRANDENPFSESDLQTMQVDHLEKVEKAIRPADYSGQGGMATNAEPENNVQALRPKGALTKKKEG